ncbi:hypothetical protein OG897_01340 [Streptomyces sp. NBC_00237]|uniref:hypothetical protein n=1 Tax=Streptomyces sp. NBC_00237 TaxID=2975687 RepID=UPI00225AF9AF|nr:hypothetical protein [Streptomyces sp. NBC_00237]MCX5200109.1 hypothetical protein [Streptomyces sp. NBC_00237]
MGRSRTPSAVDTNERELTAFARRARATTARLHPDLPLVSYTLLAHIHDQQGCRATDLADWSEDDLSRFASCLLRYNNSRT